MPTGTRCRELPRRARCTTSSSISRDRGVARVSRDASIAALYLAGPRELRKELLEHLRSRRQRSALAPRNGCFKAEQRARILRTLSTISERAASRVAGSGTYLVDWDWRPALLSEEQLRRHIGRTPLALRDVSQGREQGNANRRRCIAASSKDVCPSNSSGSLTWDRGEVLADTSGSAENRCRRRTSVTRKPLAAWLERKHKSLAAIQTSPGIVSLAGHSQAELNKLASQSTSGPGKRWTSSRLQSDLPNVLPRPVEITAKSRNRMTVSAHALMSAGDADPK